MIEIAPDIFLNENELNFSFVRASGPGGQHVNKVSTAVQLRFDAGRSPGLPGPVQNRLARLAGSRMSKDRVILIDARRFRSRERNREDAIERLSRLIQKAAQKPRRRVKSKPPAASRIRRMEDKRRNSMRKRLRRRVSSSRGL
jgi:ribosome-associated protein